MPEWPSWTENRRTVPPFARIVPWHFIVDGDLDASTHEDHAFAVWLGHELWACAGCLSRSYNHFTDDGELWPNGHPGWPRLDHAPNGTQVVMARVEDIPFPNRVSGRPLCPLRPYASRSALSGATSTPPSTTVGPDS